MSERRSDAPFGAAAPSAHPPYDSRPAELELRMAMAIAAGVADVGRSRMRPCPSGCWYCRCRSVRSLDGAIRTLVPMRSRFRVGLVRVTCRCRRCNAGNVRKLTCQNLYPHVVVLALLAGHETLRVTAGTAACSCKYCHEFRIHALKTKTGQSRLSKNVPNSPRPKKVCHVGTECLACNVLRCTSSIFIRQVNCRSD